MVIYTIGFTKKTLKTLMELLKKNAVTKIIDIRLNNTSQLAGFSKQPDFEYILKQGFNIDYEHCKELAPTKEIFDLYKKNKDFSEYQKCFIDLLNSRHIKSLVDRLTKNDTICLLCSEEKPNDCHRRLVAEYIKDNYISDLEITHL